MLISAAPAFISHAGAEQVGVIELFDSIVSLGVPVFDFHLAGLIADPGQAVTAKPSLVVHEVSPQRVLVRVALVVPATAGSTVLSKTRRLVALTNRPHSRDSRNAINARARVTSGSSGPRLASTSVNKRAA